MDAVNNSAGLRFTRLLPDADSHYVDLPITRVLQARNKYKALVRESLATGDQLFKLLWADILGMIGEAHKTMSVTLEEGSEIGKRLRAIVRKVGMHVNDAFQGPQFLQDYYPFIFRKILAM